MGRRKGEEAGLIVAEARGIGRRFGEFVALDAVDFSVRAGEVHALLGENGAGKSTLMNLLSALLRPSSGELFLGGERVQLRSPADAAQRGVGIVHQHFLLVPTLTVAENLLLGAPGGTGGPLSWPIAAVLVEAKALATRLGWSIPWDSLTGGLPLGTQQRIEILKALRGDKKLVLFDEPTAVLTPTETPELFGVIRRLADEGRGVVFISHKLDEVLTLADRITVLRRGKVVARFETRGEADGPALAAAMVGEDTEAAKMLAKAPLPTSPPNPLSRPVASSLGEGEPEGLTDSIAPPLSVRNERPGEGAGGRGGKGISIRSLTVAGSGRPELDGVNFSVAPGEIFGVAGVDGNGQDALSECLTGLRRPTNGEILIDGGSPAANPAAFHRAGVTSVPADRQRRGLALPLSLTENLTLGVHNDPRFRKGPLLSWPKLRERTKDAITRFDIRAEGPEAAASSLSGGNQQKVVLARALADSPKVVVAVNPTRGLDVGAIAFVHDALRKARDSGAAIVLISTELDEIQALADTVGVLYEGRLTLAADTSRATLGRLMGGAS